MSQFFSKISGLFRELHRRRVFRVAALYIVGAWVVMQAADVLFPALGIPDAAIRALLVAAIIGFPVALVFGWLFDIGRDGIQRTKPASAADLQEPAKLRRSDYLILAAFASMAAIILYNAVGGVLEAQRDESIHTGVTERPEHSIAVLPFVNMSNDPDNQSFCDGVSEEILHRLAEFRDLHVIARTSSFVFKKSDADIPGIAATLGVSYLLQGSVRKYGNDLRITAQLVDDTGRQIWSDSFDRKLEAVFDLQRDIAESVATAVAPQVSPSSSVAGRQPDIEAYQHYLLGREILHSRAGNYDTLAAEEFRKAIEIDPQYAEAHAELAIALTFARDRAWHLQEQPRKEQKRAEAEQAIETALALKPDLARAYAAEGLLQKVRGQDARAEAALRKALTLDPNMAEAAHWLIFVLGEEFEDERWKILQRTARIDPLLPDLNRALAWGYAERGNFAQAERTLRRLLAAPQPAQLTYHAARDFHAGIGQFVESVEISKRLVLDTALSSRRAFGINHLAESYAWLGMWDSASYWLSRKEPDWFDALILERHGRYEGILELWDQLREREGITLADQDPGWVGYYGHTQALAGAWQEAIRTLEPVVEVDTPNDVVWGDAREALVYAYQKTGAGAKAEPFLAAMGREWKAWEARGLLNYGPELVDYALFTLLSSDQDGAIELLQKAFDAGWRGYYRIVNDPRWDPLRADPRFQALMAAVKEHVEGQRAEMERIDAEENFGVGVDL